MSGIGGEGRSESVDNGVQPGRSADDHEDIEADGGAGEGADRVRRAGDERGDGDERGASRRVRVLYVIATFNIGGAERQLLELSSRLDKNLFDCQVVAFRGGPLLEEFKARGVKVTIVEKRGKIDFGLVLRLRRYIREGNFDIMHTYMFTANTWARLAAGRAARPAIIASERSVDTWKSALHWSIDRYLAKRSRAVVANAATVGRYLVDRGRLPAALIKVIPNGIDLEAFTGAPRRAASSQGNSATSPSEPSASQNEPSTSGHDSMGAGHDFADTGSAPVTPAMTPAPRDGFTVLCVGRLHPAKGQEILLASFEELLRTRSDARLILVGDATIAVEKEFKEKLLGDIAARGLTGKVHLAGFHSDTRPYLAQASVLAIPSYREGFPNVMVEAMASGVPVVATAVGGVPDIATNEESALIVKPGDSGALAAALTRLGQDRGLAAQLSEAAKRRANDFSLSRMIRTTEALYDELLS